MAARSDAGSDREVVLTRVVDAPRELVWQVWTDPAHLVKWWGPQGFTTTTHAMSFQVGGVWRFVMHGPDGHDYENVITWLEIGRPHRLRYKHGGDVDCEPVNFETSVTFDEESGGRTRVTMRSVFPSAAAKKYVVDNYNAIEGGKQHLNRLGEYVQAARAQAGQSAPFVVTRVVRAPRDLVFAAWTRKEHLEQWFGPAGCKLTVHQLELWPGGVMRYQMQFAGTELWARWVFDEIVPPERMVVTVSFTDAAGNVARSPFSATWPLRWWSKVTFTEHAGKGLGTVITLESRALDVTAAEQAAYDAGHESMRGGWAGTLDALEAHLAHLAHLARAGGDQNVM